MRPPKAPWKRLAALEQGKPEAERIVLMLYSLDADEVSISDNGERLSMTRAEAEAWSAAQGSNALNVDLRRDP